MKRPLTNKRPIGPFVSSNQHSLYVYYFIPSQVIINSERIESDAEFMEGRDIDVNVYDYGSIDGLSKLTVRNSGTVIEVKIGQNYYGSSLHGLLVDDIINDRDNLNVESWEVYKKRML